MKADLTKKERFEKAMRKALEEGRSDYLGIKEGTTLAVLDSSELSKIKMHLSLFKMQIVLKNGR